MSLPGVAELLRPVGPGPASDSGRQASGREAHPQKITVYLSADEFLDLERVRLALRAHGIGVDRGRLVREAIAVLIADLETGLDTSVITRRLRPAVRSGPAECPPVGGGPVDDTQAESAPANGVAVNGGVVNGGAVNGAWAGGGPVHGAPAGLQ